MLFVNLKSFHNDKKISKILFVCVFSIFLLTGLLVIYRTYAVYEEKQVYNVMKGQVPNQDYDISLSYYFMDTDGKKTMLLKAPTERNYNVDVVCTEVAMASWDYDKWGPLITNLINNRTKCNILFQKERILLEDIVHVSKVTSGDGLYEVFHEDAEIAFSENESIIKNLKMTEYRYVGSNPNNYVTFNEEAAGWRIIGLVNTLEGQRIKLIRDNSIGYYVYDSTTNDINQGHGVSQFNVAAINTLLNYTYYNRTLGECKNGDNNSVIFCEFAENGILKNTKELIDTVTWTIPVSSVHNFLYQVTGKSSTRQLYNYEHSNSVHNCMVGERCNAVFDHVTSFKAPIGLMSASDYTYATKGGGLKNRMACLEADALYWENDENKECFQNNWMYKNYSQMTMHGYPTGDNSHYIVYINSSGSVKFGTSMWRYEVRPTLYLKTSVKVSSGDGSLEAPFVLRT